jgi:hypothetical protein
LFVTSLSVDNPMIADCNEKVNSTLVLGQMFYLNNDYANK